MKAYLQNGRFSHHLLGKQEIFNETNPGPASSVRLGAIMRNGSVLTMIDMEARPPRLIGVDWKQGKCWISSSGKTSRIYPELFK